MMTKYKMYSLITVDHIGFGGRLFNSESEKKLISISIHLGLSIFKYVTICCIA